MRVGAGICLLVLPSAAMAQTGPNDAATIQVTGRGSVSTPPDVATLDYWAKGEGQTADEASAALAAKNKAITAGVTGLLGRGTEATGGNVVVIEAKSKDCDENPGYGSVPRRSTGPCAVIGYIATLQGHIRTPAVAKAGTEAGLAARLGANDARLQGFDLSDKAGAQKRAMAAALQDARARAEAIAEGSRVKLGPVVSISDQNVGDVTVSAVQIQSIPRPAPAAPPAPIAIDVTPDPIETTAQVFVRYAILP